MLVNNQMKEYFIKKNIYSISSMVALLGTLVALCTCMLKMYTVYKLDGYLSYFSADKELLGLNDSFSLYAVSVIVFGVVLLCIYSFTYTRLWNNFLFSKKYFFKDEKAFSEKVKYLLAFIVMFFWGEAVVAILIPFCDLSERCKSISYWCGGLVLFLFLMGAEVIRTIAYKNKKGEVDNVAIFSMGKVDYVELFDNCVAYVIMAFVASLFLVCMARFFGQDLANNKQDFYLVSYDGYEYAVVYSGDYMMLLERCEYDDETIDIFTKEQLILEKSGYVLIKEKFSEVTVYK